MCEEEGLEALDCGEVVGVGSELDPEDGEHVFCGTAGLGCREEVLEVMRDGRTAVSHGECE